MTDKPREKDFSTGGVVWDPEKKQTLMVRVRNLEGLRVWTFPKGHPEKNEKEIESALREVREETGWACEILRPLHEVYYEYERNGVVYDKTVRWYLMAPLEKEGEFDPEEILEVKWATLPEARKSVAYKTDKILVSRLAEELNS